MLTFAVPNFISTPKDVWEGVVWYSGVEPYHRGYERGSHTRSGISRGFAIILYQLGYLCSTSFKAVQTVELGDDRTVMFPMPRRVYTQTPCARLREK